jgi:hypothetical protein
VPALRYASRARTGKAERGGAGVTRRTLPAAYRPQTGHGAEPARRYSFAAR